MRRAKIVCTIGPASRDAGTLKRLVDSGMNVARMNFSHGDHATHREVYSRIRGISGTVAIMQDLQGPKIRVGELQGGEKVIRTETEVLLEGTGRPAGGEVIPVTYARLADDVAPADSIFLNDGLIHLEVIGVEDGVVRCKVLHGGMLTSRKGVNLPGVKISSPALTGKDRKDLEVGLELGVDYVALSFVRSPDEVSELKGIIRDAGSRARVIAKIEKREALERIEEIVDEADGIMIARGDLGVEIPAEEVPVAQKRVIEACILRGKPVITATQMLESMVASERPTRAEASDVANAVIDGSDAVMLSAETATGDFPVETVEVMCRIIEKAEEFAGRVPAPGSGRDIISTDADVMLTDAVCSGAVSVAGDVGAEALAVLTHTGRTARLAARRRPSFPILALTDLQPVVRQMSLVWGVSTIPVESIEETEAVFATARDRVSAEGYRGRIVITAGIPTRERHPSNTVHVIDI